MSIAVSKTSIELHTLTRAPRDETPPNFASDVGFSVSSTSPFSQRVLEQSRACSDSEEVEFGGKMYADEVEPPDTGWAEFEPIG